MPDIKISIKDRDNKTHEIVVPTDISMNLMEVIRSYQLATEGTIGICGGMAMCASCQCYITSNHNISQMEEEEEAMLSEVFNTKPNSRLSCQIFISPELDGLTCEIAPE